MALDIYAKQIPSIEIGRMDNATLLSYMNTVAGHCAADATMQAKLGNIYTAFAASANNYDTVYNPSQKDLLTDELKRLDDIRDKAGTAWHTAILAATKSPNATKQQIALQLVQLYKDYHLDVSDEYMKQTTNIQQMLQSIEGDATIMAALPGMGLDEFLTDLKTKNEAFAAKMAERTAGTVGKTTGVVAAARLDVEQKYRTLMRMVNVVSSYEGGGVLDQFILVMTAEVEHYKQILARKGVSSGSSSSGGGDNGTGNTGNTGDSGNTGDNTGNSGDSGESGDSGNTGDNPGTGGDSGGGDDNGDDNNGPIGDAE
ncbi:MAG: hypothetical protein IK144_07970 [Bacteroidaceae bacterium]|nr:hypothetical protein [Bacteroidaceae bacterium]